MTQSKQSIEVAVKAGWINYQKMYMGLADHQLHPSVPQQFRDIYMIAYAMGEERAEKRLGGKAKRGNAS